MTSFNVRNEGIVRAQSRLQGTLAPAPRFAGRPEDRSA
jgi:hypothetical protein